MKSDIVKNMSSFKNPPVHTDDNLGYDAWRKEISVWQRVTDLEEKRKALAIVLSLKGKYKDVAMEISVDDLNCDAGMEKLLKALDDNFKKSTVDSAYESYVQFENYRRNSA